MGVPDEVLGEAVQAFVVPRLKDCPGFQNCFNEFCGKNMPPQFVPKSVRRMASLPKNSSGKVLKTKLREL